MARRKTTVRSLAEELSLDVESTLVTLMDLGFEVVSASDIIPKSRLSALRAILGLPASQPEADRNVISLLASRAGLSEGEARTRLAKARVLDKARLKRVPSPDYS
jgi:hypothetical protein